jgi:isoaspartyl peptidase/L-asparaginase-like protein (Ntn-hydrolase superfamily)
MRCSKLKTKQNTHLLIAKCIVHIAREHGLPYKKKKTKKNKKQKNKQTNKQKKKKNKQNKTHNIYHTLTCIDDS